MPISAAAAWLETLGARGVQVRVRNGRLRIVPATAFKDLSDEDHAFLRAHRAETKDCVLGRRTHVEQQRPQEPAPAPQSFSSTRAAERPTHHAAVSSGISASLAGWGGGHTPALTLDEWKQREAEVAAAKQRTHALPDSRIIAASITSIDNEREPS